MLKETDYKNTWLGDYLVFRDEGKVKEGAVTHIFSVHNTNGEKLGVVKWFNHWRQYTFQCEKPLTFEQTCLRDIADFVELMTKRHKEK